jgi:hypothetical protein
MGNNFERSKQEKDNATPEQGITEAFTVYLEEYKSLVRDYLKNNHSNISDELKKTVLDTLDVIDPEQMQEASKEIDEDETLKGLEQRRKFFFWMHSRVFKEDFYNLQLDTLNATDKWGYSQAQEFTNLLDELIRELGKVGKDDEPGDNK